VEEDLKKMKVRYLKRKRWKIVERNSKVGQNPPRVVPPIKEEEEKNLNTVQMFGYMRY
jgi:hypothetical protein